MFTSEGNKSVVIGAATFSEPKFSKDPNAFDICIKVSDAADPAQSDWARLEMSSDYGKGNFADRTQAQISMDTLRKLGFEGDDLTTIEAQLSGKRAVVCVAASQGRDGDKTFYNVKYFVTGGREPEAMDKGEMLRRAKALMAGGGAASTPPPTATPAPASITGTPAPAPVPGSAKPLVSGYSPFATCKTCGGRNASTTTGICKKCGG
jgi:hypothetical protein